MNEYRAVFSDPYGGPPEYGPVRSSLQAAADDAPDRVEETHRYISGVETRKADPWRAISLSNLLEHLMVKK